MPFVLKSVLRGSEKATGKVWHHDRQQLFHRDEEHRIEASRWAATVRHAFDMMWKFLMKFSEKITNLCKWGKGAITKQLALEHFKPFCFNLDTHTDRKHLISLLIFQLPLSPHRAHFVWELQPDDDFREQQWASSFCGRSRQHVEEVWHNSPLGEELGGDSIVTVKPVRVCVWILSDCCGSKKTPSPPGSSSSCFWLLQNTNLKESHAAGI